MEASTIPQGVDFVNAGNFTSIHALVSSFAVNYSHTENLPVAPGLYSDDIRQILLIVISQVTLPLVECCGIFTNSVNLIIFYSLGLNDCVNSSFFILSLLDLLYLVISAVGWICPIFGHFMETRVNLHHLSTICIWYSVMVMTASSLLTTYIAVQRCCCVAMPLRFRGVFTRRRNLIIIAWICVISAALYTPILSKMALKTYIDEQTNTSWIAMSYADDYASILVFKDLVTGLMIPLLTQVTTLICMLILVQSLRKSSKFRQIATATSGAEMQDSKANSKAKSIEVQVVKAVTLITLIFIISNIAPIAQALARLVVEQFAAFKQYHNSFLLLVMMKHLVSHLNASLNIFVYLKYNSQYRHFAKKICCHATAATTATTTSDSDATKPSTCSTITVQS